MELYVFNIREGDKVELDDQGVSFPDPEAARREAIRTANEMVVDAVFREDEIDHRQIEVIATDGTVIAVVPLQSVIKI